MRERQIGCPVAGPNGTFDGRGQARVGPISRKVKIAEFRRRSGPFCVFLRRRREGRAAFAHDLPGRQFGRQTGHRRHLAPDGCGEILARLVEQPVRAAGRGREPPRIGKQPLGGRVEHADHGRKVCRRIEAEMRIHDGAECGGRLQIGHDARRDHRRNREDHAIAERQRHCLVAEIERRDFAFCERRARAAACRSEPRHCAWPETRAPARSAHGSGRRARSADGPPCRRASASRG